MNGVPMPLHVAVHLVGLTAALGLAVVAVVRRREAARGWIALGLGGASLAVSHIVTGSLLAGDQAWPVYLRAAGYALLAVGAAGGLIVVSPGAALVVVAVAPPAAHIAAAVAGVAAAIASARGVFGRHKASLVLGLGLALWAGADLAARTQPLTSGVLSLAGSAAVGGWLLWWLRDSLLSRFVAALIAPLLVIVVGLASASGIVISSDIERTQLDALAEVARGRAAEVSEDWPKDAAAAAEPLAGEALSDRLAPVRGQRPQLDALAQNVAGVAGMDIVLIVAADGRVAGSFDAANEGALAAGDEAVLAGADVVTIALQGLTGRSVVAVGDDSVYAFSAVPVFLVENGERRRDVIRGALALGRLAGEGFVTEVQRGSGASASVLIADRVVASTLPLADQATIARAAAPGGPPRVVSLASGPSLLATEPIEATDGAPVAILALSLDAGALAGAEEGFTRTLFAVGVAGMFAAGLIGALVVARTTRPIRLLTAAAERVAGGDLDVRSSVRRPDEVGRLGAAFDDMTVALGRREADARDAADTEAGLRGRLEVLTASIAEALVAADADGRVQAVNPAAERILGVTAAAAIGQPVERVVRGTDDGGRPLLTALGEADDPDTRAARGFAGAGRDTIAVAATAAPLRAGDGTQLGRVYVLRDVTGEAEVERMKTEFLANISHELRTPLTPIRGYAQVLRTRELDRDQTVEFATSILTSTARLERVLGLLVDFAAFEAGRVDVDLAPTKLGPVVDAAIAVARDHHPDRRVTRRFARGLPLVLVDPSLLTRALDELIDNAVKFSEGAIALTAERDGERVRLTVRDRGDGIEPGQLERITDDFAQADASSTRSFGGLGLGLTLVRRIAEGVGGELIIESTPGAGTAVHLLLPVVSA